MELLSYDYLKQVYYEMLMNSILLIMRNICSKKIY